MLISHNSLTRLSALNLARIYNLALSSLSSVFLNNELAFGSIEKPDIPELNHWQTSLDLQDEHVMNGFLLYSLLLEKTERGQNLFLDHGIKHRDRLQPALAERNKQMEGVGQEAYTHACDLCYVVFNDENGQSSKL